MIVDHIGYAVKSIEKSKFIFEKLGFSFEELIIDDKRNLKIQFGNNGFERIELLEIYDINKPSPIDLFLSKIGPTPYHICYKSNNIEEDICLLKSKGFMLVHSPDSAIAFNNKKVAFMFQKDIGIIELVEK